MLLTHVMETDERPRFYNHDISTSIVQMSKFFGYEVMTEGDAFLIRLVDLLFFQWNCVERP